MPYLPRVSRRVASCVEQAPRRRWCGTMDAAYMERSEVHMMSHDPTDLEFVSFDDSDQAWPVVTVHPMLRTTIGFSRDLSIDVEDVGSDLLDRATETPPHVHLLGAL